jgi:hypothetical protein
VIGTDDTSMPHGRAERSSRIVVARGEDVRMSLWFDRVLIAAHIASRVVDPHDFM